MNWLAWEHWGYAVLAVVGTGLAVWAVDHALMRPAVAHRLKPYRGVVAPFINVNAMLFGLTLAFKVTGSPAVLSRAVRGRNRD